MHPIIKKTLGGLPASCYVRHFIFGLLFPSFLYVMTNRGNYPIHLPMMLTFAVNSILYPYSRFAYERALAFIIGENVFLVDAILALAFKLMTMLLCWALAIFIAPFGLAYLYYFHSKATP